ncbi:hypothetical protein ES703_41123 [subsurface metagenome]
MAIKIKSATAIAKKWADVTPARSRQWEDEIRATSTDEYAAPAIAAAPIWEQGVLEAAARGAYAKGIADKAEKWKRKSLAVGTARFGPGVRAAESDQAAGFAPYREIIAGMTLTPRGPRGAPGNYDRVRQIGEALHDARTGG